MARIVSVKMKGDFKKSEGFLHGLIQTHYRNKLERFGREGVEVLRNATPRDTGLTAESWTYEIVDEDGRLALYWKNKNIQNGINIAVILQYGHATRTGGWVEGIDYINPALRPVFDKMASEVWKEVIE